MWLLMQTLSSPSSDGVVWTPSWNLDHSLYSMWQTIQWQWINYHGQSYVRKLFFCQSWTQMHGLKHKNMRQLERVAYNFFKNLMHTLNHKIHIVIFEHHKLVKKYILPISICNPWAMKIKSKLSNNFLFNSFCLWFISISIIMCHGNKDAMWHFYHIIIFSLSCQVPS